MLMRIVAAMRNSPITPPPATFACPRVPSVSFDVCEAVKKQQQQQQQQQQEEISAPDYYSAELIPFYKNAIWQLKERMGSADRQFMAMARQTAFSQMKMEAAALPPNRPKNRYVNVLPFDDTRVKLDAISGSNILSSDYINASFLTDPVREDLPVFIATQAPLNSTVMDFWQMVVQQKCPVVVMLTKLQDGSQERCAHYFPTALSQSEQFGQLRVTNTSANFLQDHRTVQRVLEIQSIRDSSISHTVIHLEFRDWPDFGVPSSTAPVREMIKSLQCVPASAGPFVIHCSAGIGRTGTFCAADHSIRRILSGDETALDVGQTVLHFRSQRSGIVQTKEQYRFIFAAVIDELEEIVANLTGST